MDQQQINKIYELYNKNYTYKDIAAVIGTSDRNVAYHVSKGLNNGKIRRRVKIGKKVTCFDETILSMYQNKYTHKEIAKEIGMSEGYVDNKIRDFRKNGRLSGYYQHHRPFQITDPIVDKIITMYNVGSSRAKIAEILNVTEASVVHAIRVADGAGKITRKKRECDSERYTVHKARRDTAIALYSLGYAVKDIADLLTVNNKTVYKYIMEWRDINSAKEESD